MTILPQIVNINKELKIEILELYRTISDTLKKITESLEEIHHKFDTAEERISKLVDQ